MAKGTFVDVNKEAYMKALFLDVQKQAKMVEFPDSAELIHNFVLNNPTRDSGQSLDKYGLTKKNGLFVIHRKPKN